MKFIKFKVIFKFLIFIGIISILAILFWFQETRFIFLKSQFKYQNATTVESFIQSTPMTEKFKEKHFTINKTNSFSFYTNIAIIQLVNKNHNVYTESIKNKQFYSDIYNYTLLIYKPIDFSRHVVWYKCISILSAFNKTQPNDWIWMIDSDTYITNMNIQLNRLTAIANQLDYHMILSRDCNNINAGSILFRNSQLSMKFIIDVWNSLGKQVALNDKWREQRGIIAMAAKPEYSNSILWVPQISLNSYPIETKCHLDREWKIGDFLIHFAGNHNEELFFKYVKQANELTISDLKKFDTENWLNHIMSWRNSSKNLNNPKILVTRSSNLKLTRRQH